MEYNHLAFARPPRQVPCPVGRLIAGVVGVAVGGRTCLRHTQLTSPAPSKWDHDAAFMCRHKAGGLNSAQTKQTINGLSTPNQTLSNPLTLLFHLVTDIKGCKSSRELITRLRRSRYINPMDADINNQGTLTDWERGKAFPFSYGQLRQVQAAMLYAWYCNKHHERKMKIAIRHFLYK